MHLINQLKAETEEELPRRVCIALDRPEAAKWRRTVAEHAPHCAVSFPECPQMRQNRLKTVAFGCALAV